MHVIYERYRTISSAPLHRLSASPQGLVWHLSSVLSGVSFRWFQLLLLHPLLHRVQRLHLIMIEIRLTRRRLHIDLPYPRVLHLRERMISLSSKNSIAVLPYNAFSQLLPLSGSTRVPQMAMQVLRLLLCRKPLHLTNRYPIWLISLMTQSVLRFLHSKIEIIDSMIYSLTLNRWAFLEFIFMIIQLIVILYN